VATHGKATSERRALASNANPGSGQVSVAPSRIRHGRQIASDQTKPGEERIDLRRAARMSLPRDRIGIYSAPGLFLDFHVISPLIS